MNFARMEDYLIILWLTTDKIFQFLSYCSVARLPISPAAEKKKMQQLKLSPEKKKAEQNKKRLYVKKFHEAEESIDTAASRKKG